MMYVRVLYELKSAVEPKRCLLLDVCTSSLEVALSVYQEIVTSFRPLIPPVLYVPPEVQFNGRKPIVSRFTALY